MNDRPEWQPPKERPLWPWVVLALVVVAVTVNVLVTV